MNVSKQKQTTETNNAALSESLQKALALIKKGVAEIHNEDELIRKLIRSEEEGRPLVVKLGLDPTAPDLHLGHTVVLRKIRQLQSLGHEAVLIIGDFTGRIGDPTGNDKGRPQLSEADVLANAETYRAQLGKVLDMNRTVVSFNSQWLDAMKPSELLQLMSRHTVARVLERDSFKKRMASGQPIGLHELVYPLLQGLDSVNVHADIEIGGMDQKFNILAGRDVQAKAGEEKQVAILMPIIEGLDGVEKMSKSKDNTIDLESNPDAMFQKVMTLKDHLIVKWFNLLTDMTPSQIKDILKRLSEQGENPRDIKMILAKEMVKLYHSEKAAEKAAKNFDFIFTQGQIPEDIPAFTWKSSDTLLSFLTSNNVVESRSEVRRLVSGRGVKVNDYVIVEPEVVGLKPGDVIRIGKKRFVKVA